MGPRMNHFFAVLVVCLSASAILLPRNAAAASAEYELLTKKDGPMSEARGVWSSRGYGWILNVDSTGIAVYQSSKVDCSLDPRPERFHGHFLYRDKASTPKQLTVVQYPGENRYVFDRLERLPDSCQDKNWSAPRLFEHVAASYREQYAFFKVHHFDWEDRVQKARSLVTKQTSPRVLFAIFSDMLDGLGDGHVGLDATFRGELIQFRTGRGATFDRLNALAEQTGRSPSDVKNHWLEAYGAGVRNGILQGRVKEASGGKVVWGLIGTDIGYINVSSVENFTQGSLADNIQFINSLLDQILAEFVAVKSVILDVTNNSGGYDRLAREIVGHFAATKTLAYTKRAYGADGVAPDVFYAEPSPGRRFTGPTYLLTSDVTVSGGEILAMTMRVLPNVTQVGTATRGALSDRLTKVLPDGSDFSISNEIYLDPEGVLFEGIGVPVHRPLEIFPSDDLEGGHVKAVHELVARIKNGAAARSKGVR
jgi:carboxyl-terminal processing protease